MMLAKDEHLAVDHYLWGCAVCEALDARCVECTEYGCQNYREERCDGCMACTDSERYDEHIHCDAEHDEEGCLE